MKGDITLKILEAIKEGSLDMVDLLMAFATSGYGASHDAILKKQHEISLKRASRSDVDDIKKKVSKDEWKKINNRFHAAISKLEKDDLIQRSKDKNSVIIKITNSGKSKLHELRNRKKFSGDNYRSEKSGNLILFVFDIPEVHRKKRGWIREILRGLDFRMIQQSVWVGKTKIPEEFLEALRESALISSVEIIEITKTGTMRDLKDI